MLRPGQPNSLGAIITGPLGIARVVGVGPNTQLTDVIGPLQELDQVRVVDVGHDGVQLSDEDLALGAIQRNPITFLDDQVADCHLSTSQIQLQLGDADDGRLAELARDQGGMAGAAAAAGQDTLSRQHAVHIIGLGLGPDHDDLAAVLLRPLLGGVGVKGNLTDGCARRHVQPGGDAFTFVDRLFLSFPIKLRVQEEINLVRADTADSHVLIDQPFISQVDRDANSCLRGPLAVAGLEHPQRAVFNGELDVLDLFVMFLQALADGLELFVGFGHFISHLFDFFGLTDASDDVFALGVGQIVAFQFRLTRGNVAGGGDAGARILSHIAEDHGLHVDGSAQLVGDAGRVAVVDGSFAVPGAKDRVRGQPELLVRLLREFPAGFVFDDLLETADDVLPILRRQLGVDLDAFLVAFFGDDLFKGLIGHAHDHPAVHLHQSSVRVVDKAGVVGQLDHALGGFFIQANVQDRVHHARH